MNRMQAAEQFRKAMQLFAESLSDETAAIVATVYESWTAGKTYDTGKLLTHGTNSVGDPQLYRVLQAHTAQATWLPEAAPSLYEPIGLNESGIPLWSQPAGAHDAYEEGDIVDYDGVIYRSLISGNVYSPAEYPAGWEIMA